MRQPTFKGPTEESNLVLTNTVTLPMERSVVDYGHNIHLVTDIDKDDGYSRSLSPFSPEH
jgi:hypothetical protein